MAKSTRKIPLKQQPVFKRLRDLLKQTSQRDLLWYYRAGECVNRLFPDEGGRQYGQGRMTEIAAALGKPERFAQDLWNFRQFFYGYPRDEVKLLCDTRNTGGFRLSWTHVRCLLTADESNRLKFQDRCIKQRWSTDELRRAILDYQGRKSSGGKPFARPKTLDAGLRQIITESETWIRRHRQVWFDADRPVISVKNPQENPEQIPGLLREAIESWETIASLTEEYLPLLRQMESWCRKAAGQETERKTAKKAKPKKKTSRKR